ALAPVAAAVERVTDSGPDKSPAALLDLLLVVRRICAGLTATYSNGDRPAQSLPPSGPWRSASAAADVYAVHESLPGKSFRDREILTEVVLRGGVADLRLVPPLLDTFRDGSGESIDFILEQALPSFEPAVVPELWRSLKLKLTRDSAW